MPKIDIDKITIDTATGYPSPFNKAVEGRSRKRLARFAGLTQFGVNICTLKPGEDGGETVLRPGDVVAWKAGVANGHRLINRSSRDTVFSEVGTRAAADRAHYSDIDMMVVRDEKGARYTKKNGETY